MKLDTFVIFFCLACIRCGFHVVSAYAIVPEHEFVISRQEQISSKRDAAIDHRIQQLFQLVEGSQVLEGSTFVPFVQFYKQKGVYPSFMKGNFHGTFDQAILRNDLRFFDNNVFTTCYVLTVLLEAFAHSGAPQPSEKKMLLGLDTFLDYQDMNRPYNHSILSFWPIKYNPVQNFWHANPANTLPYLDIIEYIPVKTAAGLLGMVGLQNIDEFLEDFSEDREENKKLLFLPPDQDTSIIHIAFGATLKGLENTYPHAWTVWDARNPRKSSVFEAFKQYSYRPFSADDDASSIDPRTYFYLRHFLDEAHAKGKDVALITTWTQTLSEQSQQWHRGSTMVRGINNVCLGVTANAVLGITRAVLSGVIEEALLEEDPLMAQIYLNSSTLLAYQLDTNLTGRPDLALLYYPTRVQFEWMVSRTVAELEAARRLRVGGLSPLMQAVYDTLLPSGQGSITRRLLHTRQVDHTGRVYFEDFLGTADVSPKGKPAHSGEDRIFCTALAANTLINIWTYPTGNSNPRQQLLWHENTPAAVIETVAQAVQWLILNSVSGEFKPYGAFFSASYKWSRTLPYRYPGNRYQFVNGTEIWPWSSYLPDHRTSYMVRGYIPAEQYHTLMGEEHFGQAVPQDFHGYNADHRKYMWYWDSEPLTYSVTLLALAKYRSIFG